MHRARNTTLLLFSLIVLPIPFLIKSTSKNTCNNYFEYILINFSDNCYYNPDVDLSVPKIIEKYAGSVQAYNVTTEDGYVLTMFRIPRPNAVGVILLQPPMSAGSVAYLSDGADSLAFAIWNKGYDVWLSNHRGTTYSRNHLNLSDSNPDFWQYGFHEIAMFDLEAQFQLIAKETESKFTYLGYSMAATEALVYSSLKPDSATKYMDNLVLVAPMTVLTYFSSIPFKYLLYGARYLGAGEYFTFEAVRRLGGLLTIAPYLTSLMTSGIMGWTPTEMDPVLYPYIFAHHGRGISNGMLKHYGQIFDDGKYFRMLNYGATVNRQKYGSDEPPAYPLQKIKNPVYLVYGDRDKVATPMDVKFLAENLLPKDIVKGVFSIDNHNHIDYMFSKHRKKKFYETVLTILDEVQNEYTVSSSK